MNALTHTVSHNEVPYVDKSRDTHSSQGDDEADSDSVIIPHPLGVRPSGNALTADGEIKFYMGDFERLPDEVLMTLLEWLEPTSLLNLGASCRHLFAYTAADQLWRDIFVLNPIENVSWRGSWRSTYLGLPTRWPPIVDCATLFSDSLYRPFFCSQIRLSPYASTIPSSNRIPQLADLSASDFAKSWTNRPFILTGPVKNWPVYRTWSEDFLVDNYSDVVFRVEAVDWPFRTYVDYMNNNLDESPLYLFDREFVEKMNLQGEGNGGDYWPPECFGEDLFNVLGDQRPDHRWLIVGPKRSGSTFHKDPNATSAWNAVIRGSKYWIMFPSSDSLPPPPGVYVSEDQSEVTSPLSIAEWLLNFHAEARNTAGCLEGVCNEGEVLHVPSGWWHLVVNLEPSIAITQNFVPQSHLSSAIEFLKTKPEQVSGFGSGVEDPYALFINRLREHHPELIESSEKASKKRKWDELIHSKDKEQGMPREEFSFGFGVDSDGEEEI